MSEVSHVHLRPLGIADYEEVHALWSGTEGIGLSESDTREAVAFFLQRNPALSPVAALARLPGLSGNAVGVILSGGNVDLDRLPWLMTPA